MNIFTDKNNYRIGYPLVKAGAIFLAVILVYYPLKDAGFIWDDDNHLLNDKLQMLPDALYRIWLQPDASVWNYWPLTRSSFWLERQLWGTQPAGFHITNILLHGLSAIVLYMILLKMDLSGAWIAAMLFALHPMAVESVAWVTERKNTLSIFFCFLSFWAYLHANPPKPRLISGWLLASWLLFGLALLSKSSVVMLPAFLLLMGLVNGTIQTGRQTLPLIPFFLLSLVSAWLTIYFETHSVGTDAHYFDRTIAEKLIVAGFIPFFYIKNFIFPADLVFIYPRWNPDPFNPVHYIPFFVLLAIAIALAWPNRSSLRKALLICLGGFVIMLLPVLGIFKVYGMRFSFVSDHWAYPAIPLLCTLAGLAYGRLVTLNGRWAPLAAALLITACGLISWQNTYRFMDSESLWRSTLKINPQAAIAHNHMAAIYANKGEIHQAYTHLNQAMRADPHDSLPYQNRAIIRERLGDYKGAIQDLTKAAELSPLRYPDLHERKAFLYSLSGNVGASLEEYDLALAKTPDNPRLYHLKGEFLLKQRRFREAAEVFASACSRWPDSITLLEKYGYALTRSGNRDAAEMLFLAFQQKHPENKEILALLQRFYFSQSPR